MTAHNHCEHCGRSRAAGWLIVNRGCMDCKPEEFEARREELRAQARKLIEEN